MILIFLTVLKVIDGDTVVTSDGQKIRYIGIDTPEIYYSRNSAEYFGYQAKDFNKKLVKGKNVKLEFDSEHFDKYDRALAYVYLEDGTFVNAELVKEGYARVMTIEPNTKYADLFKRLEKEAKAKKLGMWSR